MRVHISPPRASGGVQRVIEGLERHLASYGVEITSLACCDIAHVHAAMPLPYGKPVVYHNHGCWPDEAPMARRENFIIFDNVQYADAVICPSRWQGKIYEQRFGIRPHYIPNGIELSELTWPPSDQGYILWAKTRIDYVLDPADFLRLAAQFPDLDFVTTLINSPPPDNVAVMGILPFPRMQEVLSGCSVYCTTAGRELFGIMTLEAWAYKKPVLARAGGGNSELITHKKDGYLYASFPDMVTGLRYCLSHPEMGERGYKNLPRYEWKNLVGQMVKVYREVLDDS